MPRARNRHIVEGGSGTAQVQERRHQARAIRLPRPLPSSFLQARRAAFYSRDPGITRVRRQSTVAERERVMTGYIRGLREQRQQRRRGQQRGDPTNGCPAARRRTTKTHMWKSRLAQTAGMRPLVFDAVDFEDFSGNVPEQENRECPGEWKRQGSKRCRVVQPKHSGVFRRRCMLQECLPRIQQPEGSPSTPGHGERRYRERHAGRMPCENVKQYEQRMAQERRGRKGVSVLPYAR